MRLKSDLEVASYTRAKVIEGMTSPRLQSSVHLFRGGSGWTKRLMTNAQKTIQNSARLVFAFPFLCGRTTNDRGKFFSPIATHSALISYRSGRNQIEGGVE
jgi:hypothetical protein